MNSLLATFLMLWLGVPPAVVDGSAIKDAVKRFVEVSLKDTGEEVRIDFRAVPDTIRVSSPEYRIEVEPVGAGRLRGPCSMMISIMAGENVARRIPVSMTVHRFADVLVAARPLERHAALTAADLRSQRMETTMLQAGYCLNIGDVAGLRTKRMFTEGSVVYAGMCEPVPLVRQGDIVTLVVRAGTVSLSAKATAKQDGARGELINVQREGSHDRIRARVRDGGIVEAWAE